MNIIEFMKKNSIAILVEANLNDESFTIIKINIDLESYDLFEQLIIFGSPEKLLQNISNQLKPKIWTQGATKCVISQLKNDKIIALFYDTYLNAKDNYFYAKRLDAELNKIF